MGQEVWITLRLPIGVDSGARYHHDDVLDPGARWQGARGSRHFANEIVSVCVELSSPLDKPAAPQRYPPPPCLTA
jgi:hypothetical protein